VVGGLFGSAVAGTEVDLGQFFLLSALVVGGVDAGMVGGTMVGGSFGSAVAGSVVDSVLGSAVLLVVLDI
jgi:hypothetical protein